MSIEKSDETYDRKLTLLSMGCSSKSLINVNGEINIAMKKILTMSVFAGNQLKQLKHVPEILFCLRNMADTDSSKLGEALASIEKEL